MRVILLFILFFGVYKLEAQQWVQFSQSSNYGTFLNPAYAGYKSVLNATIAHRSQYVGLGTKAIGTQLASFSSPFQSSKFGLGFRIVNDFIGLQRYTNIDLNAAYHILEGKNRLSGGVNFGLIQFGLNGAELTAPDGDYLPGVIAHNDDFLPVGSSAGMAPTLSFGLLYGYKNFEVGISLNNLTSPKINISNTTSGIIINISRTINIHSLYVIELNNLKVKPAFFCKTDFNKWQAQLNVQLDWRKMIAGLGFRGYSGLNNDAVIGLLGFKLKDKISILYSYDYNVSFLNNSNSGSHELSLRFDLQRIFKQNVKSNIIFSPRYL